MIDDQQEPADNYAHSQILPSLGITMMLILGGAIFGYLIIALPLKFTFVLCAGIASLALTLYSPTRALSLFFASVIMLTDSPPGSDDLSFAIIDPDVITGLPSAISTFFLMLVGITSIRLVILKREFPSVSCKPLLVFTVILLTALLTGIHHGWTSEILRVDFMNMLFPALCFYLCVALLDTRKSIHDLLLVLFAAAAVKALILTGFYLAGRGWIYRLDNTDAYRVATMDSADLLVFIILMLIGLHLLLQKQVKGLYAILTAVACIPMVFVIVFAYRRAQWVGTILALALLYIGTTTAVRKRMTMLIFVCILAATSALTLSGSLSEERFTRISSRLTSVFDRKQSSNVYHLLESRQTLHDIRETPILGLGLGSHHSPLGLYDEDVVPTNVVHNTFLYIWMKTGLSGLVFFLVCGAYFVRNILRYRRHHLNDDGWVLLLPIGASLGLWLTMFLTGPVPWYFHQTYLIALFSAIGVRIIQQDALQEEEA